MPKYAFTNNTFKFSKLAALNELMDTHFGFFGPGLRKLILSTLPEPRWSTMTTANASEEIYNPSISPRQLWRTIMSIRLKFHMESLHEYKDGKLKIGIKPLVRCPGIRQKTDQNWFIFLLFKRSKTLKDTLASYTHHKAALFWLSCNTYARAAKLKLGTFNGNQSVFARGAIEATRNRH